MRSITRSVARAVVGLAIAVAVLAGCGGDDDGDTTPVPTVAEPAPAIDAESTTTTAPPPASTTTAAAGQVPETDPTVGDPAPVDPSLTGPSPAGLPAGFPAEVIFPVDHDLFSAEGDPDAGFTVIVAVPADAQAVFDDLVAAYQAASWTVVEQTTGDGFSVGTAITRRNGVQVEFSVEPAEAATAVTYQVSVR